MKSSCSAFILIIFWIALFLTIGIFDMKFFRKEKREKYRSSSDNSFFSASDENLPLLLEPKPHDEFSDQTNSSEDNALHKSPKKIPPSEYDYRPRENETFTEELERIVEESYPDKIIFFTEWVSLTVRRLKMLHDLYNMQNMTNTYEENFPEIIDTKVKTLVRLQTCLNRRNKAGKFYYLLLFDLERFLSNTPSSLIISNSEICSKLCTLLETWLTNACFDYKNFERLKVFLKIFFRDGMIYDKPERNNFTIRSIYFSWKNSLFSNERRQEMIDENRNFVNAFYYSVLIDRFEADLEEAAFSMKSFTQIGQSNIEKFHDFLDKYRIPYSGPFKNFEVRSPKLVYFISSLNPSDAIINNFAPIYGCYEFDLASLNLGPSDSQDFWANLDYYPYWLNHFPPWYNLGLDSLREQITNFRF